MKLPARIALLSAYLAVLGVLVGLGTWQLLRGMEKAAVRDRLDQMEDRTISLQAAPADWDAITYQQAELTGQWDHAHTFLLDNRISSGVPGVEVLTPFTLEIDDSTLLVNRGWIAKNQVEQVMSRYSGQQSDVIMGQIYIPSAGFTLGPAYTDSGRWPVVIQYIDTQAISELLGRTILDPVLVMDDSSDGFTKIWKPYVISAERHYGYAIQWWGLAIVFVVFGLIWKREAAKSGQH